MPARLRVCSLHFVIVTLAPVVAFAQVAPRDAPPDAPATPPTPTTSSQALAPADGAEARPATKRRRADGSDRDDRGEGVVTWDLNIEGAYGRAFGDTSKPAGFGRLRGGILTFREPFFFALGATYEISPFSPATFGIQAEALHLATGFWGQVGGLLDVQPRPGVMASVGWSLFGAEAQYRTYDKFGLGDTLAIYAKIRIPVSIIAWALRTRARE